MEEHPLTYSYEHEKNIIKSKTEALYYEDNAEYNKRFSTLANVLHREIEPVRYLVDGLIKRNSINIISGEPASFKTWAAYQLAKDIATGEKFLGQFETFQTGVAILDGEMGVEMFQEAMLTLGAREKLPIYYCHANGDELSTEEHIESLKVFCTYNDVKVVIIDSLTRFHNSDENSSREMSAVFKLINKLKDSLTVIIIHHDKKGGNSAFGGRSGNALRGSSDIVGAVDGVIRMRRQDGSDAVIFEQAKSRGFVEHKPFKARFQEMDKSHSQWKYIGKQITKEDRFNEDKRSLLSYICEHPGMNKKALYDKIKADNKTLDLSGSKFRSLIQALDDNGKIRLESGKRSEKLVYPANNLTEVENHDEN